MPEAKEPAKAKDWWDKSAIIAAIITGTVAMITGAVSGVLIPIAALWFTYAYQARDQAEKDRQELERHDQEAKEEVRRTRELKIARMQAVQAFFPYLKRTEPEKKAALLIIRKLDVEVATSLAELFPSPGAVSALSVIAKSPKLEEKSLAASSLRAIAVGTGESAEAKAAALRWMEERYHGALINIKTTSTTQTIALGSLIGSYFAISTAQETGLSQGHDRIEVLWLGSGMRIPLVRRLPELPDLALLVLNSQEATPEKPVLTIATRTPQIGEPLVTYGFSSRPPISGGRPDQPAIVQVLSVDIPTGPFAHRALFRVSDPKEAALSVPAGAPLLDVNGELVGVMTAIGATSGEHLAVRVDKLPEAVRRAGLSLPTLPATPSQ